MKEYKYKFISSKFIFLLCMFGIVICSVLLFGVTFYSIWYEIPAFLVGDIIALAFLTLYFVLLRKEVYFVKVYDDKIIFKALWKKERVLYLSDIKNIYDYSMLRVGRFYIFGTRDIVITKLTIVDTNLPEKDILKLGYPFKIAANQNTTKIIREFWEKPIIKITWM